MFDMLRLALLAAAAPAFAWSSEGLFGLAPCELCLWQRWPYWVAAVLALGAALLPRARRPLALAAIVAILVSGAIGGFHVGVEQGWWPSPLAGCQAPTSAGFGSLDAMLKALPMAPSKPCDAPTFLVPGLPLSMAAMNLLYALGISMLGLISLRRGATA
jgi:disulfide bond formation protein DsbB